MEVNVVNPEGVGATIDRFTREPETARSGQAYVHAADRTPLEGLAGSQRC